MVASPDIRFHSRRARRIENESIRVTITVEGGHIAEILHKRSGVNPLWIPPWPSIEPSTYSAERHPEYGRNAESKLLSGIVGHNLCLDLFGPPSAEEAAAGVPVHGEACVLPYEIVESADGLTTRCTMPIAQLSFERKIVLKGGRVLIAETLTNRSPLDRPIAWTQHVTLGPPFLERGATQFRLPATKSLRLADSATFDWPWMNGEDRRVYTSRESSGGYTAHLLNPQNDRAYFLAHSPATKVVMGYVWQRRDFPWIGIWEENHSRTHAPWNGRTLTCGMEFGISPIPETRRQMIERGTLFGERAYRWIPARSELQVEYWAAILQAEAIPESLEEFEKELGRA